MNDQQSFAFMTASSGPVSVSRKEQRPAKEPATKSPRPKISRSARLLFPLEPFVRTKPTILAPGNDTGFFPASETINVSSQNDADSRQSLLRKLRSQVGAINFSSQAEALDCSPRLSTGCHAIDTQLLDGGLKPGTVNEWVGDELSTGAVSLSLIAAANQLADRQLADRQLTSKHAVDSKSITTRSVNTKPTSTEPIPKESSSTGSTGPLMVIDPSGCFYPPAAVSLGIPQERMILVRPKTHRDLVWAIDQSLRCRSVSAVWATLPARVDDRDARRFQLAAEEGQTMGFFVRPAIVRSRPRFSDSSFYVRQYAVTKHTQASDDFRFTAPICVTLDRGRGVAIGKSVWVKIDANANLHQVHAPEMNQRDEVTDRETAAMHLASRLANPSTPATDRQAGDVKRRRA